MHQGRLLVAESPQALKEAFAGELLELRTPDLRAAFGFSRVGPVGGKWLGNVYYAACAAAFPLLWATAFRRRPASARPPA